MPCSVILTVSDLAGTPELPAFSSDSSSLSTFVLSCFTSMHSTDAKSVLELAKVIQ